MISFDDAFDFFLDADIYGEIDIIAVLHLFYLKFIRSYRSDPCRSASDDLSVLSAKHIIEILFDSVIRIIAFVHESKDIGEERTVLVISLGIGFHAKPMEKRDFVR